MKSSHDEAELDLVIARRTDEADGVVSLDLQHPQGADLPAWAPGAHIDLVLGPDLARQYSLCSDPADTSGWRIAVLREPAPGLRPPDPTGRGGRGGSQRVHDELHQGAMVRVRGPRNHFALEPAERYIFIAGGIGITPIMAMVRAADQSAGARWTLLYGGRSRATMAFREQLEPYGERVAVWPQDEFGLLDLDALLERPAAGTLVYCCGPEPLLRAVEQRCADWPAGALRVERFAPKEMGPAVLDETFEVELARTGVTVKVGPGASVLRAVEEAGVQVLSSCREGTCGTCETTVLDGAVDHRDSLLTPEEQAANDTMMICVSRAACPRLVLDL